MQKFIWTQLHLLPTYNPKLSSSKNHLTPSKAPLTAAAGIIIPNAEDNTQPLEPWSYTAIARPCFQIAADSISSYHLP